MKILLTGFGPFMTVKENVSERLARDIERTWRKNGWKLKVVIAPVEWTATERLLEKELARYRPDIIVGLGHGEPCASLEIELRHFNKADERDNAGELRDGGVVKKEGPDSYAANIDAHALVEYLLRQQIPAVIHDAREGVSYLCNFAGYIIANAVCTMAGLERSRFVFIHIPSPKDLDYKTSLCGVEKALDFLTQKTDENGDSQAARK